MAVPIAPAPPVTTAIRPCRGSRPVVMACSRVYLHVVAEVQADRLQDRKGGGTVNTSTAPSTPVYFSMTGAAAAVSDPVQIPLHASDVVALVIDGRADGGRRNRHVSRPELRGARSRGPRCHCGP